MKLVSIVIVNFNGGKIFKECVSSLFKINYPRWELIVVDNGSTDGSEKINIPHKLIKNKINLGFAPANNQGYKSTKGEYVLFLNNDTKVTPRFLTVLVESMEENEDLGIAQPKIFLMDKQGYLDNAGSFLTRTGFLEHWGFGQKDDSEFAKEREIFSAKGACMLVRRKVIEKVGLFDSDYISYFEESDFCWRVWLAGYKVMFIPSARIYHRLGFTSKKQNQISVNYHSLKNRLCTLIKNLEFGNLFLIGGLHLIFISTLSFYYLIRLQFAKSLMVWRAIVWNLVHLPMTLRKRRQVQLFRKRNDWQVFQSILRATSLKDMIVHFRKVEANF